MAYLFKSGLNSGHVGQHTAWFVSITARWLRLNFYCDRTNHTTGTPYTNKTVSYCKLEMNHIFNHEHSMIEEALHIKLYSFNTFDK